MSTQTSFGWMWGAAITALLGCNTQFDGAMHGPEVVTHRADGSMIVELNGEKSVIAAEGKAVPLPEKWPADFPVFPGGRVVAAHEAPDSLEIEVRADVKLAEFDAFYVKALADHGWMIVDSSRDESSIGYQAKKGTRTIVAEAYYDEEGFSYLTLSIFDAA